jgi:hypothetical protein
MMLTFPSSQFCSFSRSKGISTEASNLKGHGLHTGEFPSQFYIQGVREKKLFLHQETHRDNEGDITHVTYFHPGDARIPQVTLWND